MSFTALGFVFGLVPRWVWAGLLALLVAGLTVQTLRVERAHSALAAEQRERAEELARTVKQSLIAEQAARAEGDRRVEAQQEVIRHAQTQLDRARADGAAAGAAADRLRQRAAALAAGCGRPAADPAAASPSPATAGPGLVLADVLGRSDDTSGELAAAYDESRARGLACERAYDVLGR